MDLGVYCWEVWGVGKGNWSLGRSFGVEFMQWQKDWSFHGEIGSERMNEK